MKSTATTTVVVEELPASAVHGLLGFSDEHYGGRELHDHLCDFERGYGRDQWRYWTVANNGTRIVSAYRDHYVHADRPQRARPGHLQLSVQVTQGTAPRVVRFTADPTTINSGNASTLSWGVENARRSPSPPWVRSSQRQQSGSSDRDDHLHPDGHQWDGSVRDDYGNRHRWRRGTGDGSDDYRLRCIACDFTLPGRPVVISYRDH